jgi:hypothetical protein
VWIARQRDDSCLRWYVAGWRRFFFIMPLKRVYNIKLIASFWNFLFNIFGPRLTMVTETGDSETTDERETTVVYL